MNILSKSFIVVGVLLGVGSADAAANVVQKSQMMNPIFVAITSHFALHMRSHQNGDHEPVAFVIRPLDDVDTTQLTAQNFEDLFAHIFTSEICGFLRAISFKDCNLSAEAYKSLLGFLSRFCLKLQYIDLRDNPLIRIFHEGKELLQSTSFAGAAIFYTLIQSDEHLQHILEKAAQSDLFESIVLDSTFETEPTQQTLLADL